MSLRTEPDRSSQAKVSCGGSAAAYAANVGATA